MKNLTHIFAQEDWHDDCFIVADEEGLIKLKNAIDRALKSKNNIAVTQSFTNDGEGYDIYVIKEGKIVEKDLMVPYTWEEANPNHSGLKPWELLNERLNNYKFKYFLNKKGRLSELRAIRGINVLKEEEGKYIVEIEKREVNLIIALSKANNDVERCGFSIVGSKLFED